MMKWLNILKNESNPVLIYQMGKVGSSSLEKSLPNSLHLHDLMSISAVTQISPVRAKLYQPITGYLKRNVKRFIFQYLLKKKSNVKIISIVREPIGRNISMFFQALPFWLVEKYVTDDTAVREEKTSLLEETFYQHFNHQYPVTWFDKEIRKLTGIDVFATPFDTELGHQRYSNENYDLLVLRMDKLYQSKVEIEDFLGKKIELTQDNQSHKKWYSPLSNSFRKIVSLNTEYIDSMLSSRLSQHFFSQEEIAQLSDQYHKNNNEDCE